MPEQQLAENAEAIQSIEKKHVTTTVASITVALFFLVTLIWGGSEWNHKINTAITRNTTAIEELQYIEADIEDIRKRIARASRGRWPWLYAEQYHGEVVRVLNNLVQSAQEFNPALWTGVSMDERRYRIMRSIEIVIQMKEVEPEL